MKTKFSVRQDVFGGDSGRNLDEDYKYYEDYYKDAGFILDKRDEDVYKMYEKDFNLKEGDRIFLAGMYLIVYWKAVEIDNDLTEYSLIEE